MWSSGGKNRKAKIVELADKLFHAIIFLNITIICLETFEELKDYYVYFRLVENISIGIFAIEYVIRVYLAIQTHTLKVYVLSWLGIIDLISFLPFFLPIQSFDDARFIKILRLFRLFRIFKLYRYSEHLQTIIEVVRLKLGDLLAILFSTVIVLLFCSLYTFHLEHEAQPTVFKNIFSALWWGISTLTTIGYGDIFPITHGGKIIASFLALIGVGLIAIASAILTSGFNEVKDRKKIGDDPARRER